MLEEIHADLVKQTPPQSLLVIPVNIVGVAGKGLALWMRLRFPIAYDYYVKRCRRGNISHGELAVVDVGAFKLVMFPTKLHWSAASDPLLIKRSFERLHEYMMENEIDKVYMPHVGCGHRTGMLNWEEDVRPLAAEVFAADPRVTLYVLDKF